MRRLRRVVVGLSEAEEVRDDEGRDERDPEEVDARAAVEPVERARDLGGEQRAHGRGGHRADMGRRHHRSQAPLPRCPGGDAPLTLAARLAFSVPFQHGFPLCEPGRRPLPLDGPRGDPRLLRRQRGQLREPLGGAAAPTARAAPAAARAPGTNSTGTGGSGGGALLRVGRGAGGGSTTQGLDVTPTTLQTITVAAGQTTPTVTYKATLDGKTINVGWGVDLGNVGTIPAGPSSTAVFAPTGSAGGLVTVTAGLNGKTVQRQVMVKLTAAAERADQRRAGADPHHGRRSSPPAAASAASAARASAPP